MAKSKRNKDPDRYAAPPPQSAHSAQLVNRALYYIRSEAHAASRSRPKYRPEKMKEFQGRYDTIQKLNIPIVCKMEGDYINCFKHPPLDKNPPKVSASFSGKHCRDGEGKFVPVAQCRGRVVGRDKKGKFVSMKG